MPNDPTWDETTVAEPSWEDTSEVAAIPAQPPSPTSGLERAARDWRMGGLAQAKKGTPPPALDQSIFGISPEMVPSGAATRAPWLTIPLSVAGKTAAGVAGYLTSPQGVGETAAAATPAAPLIFAKWAYDMARSGVDNVRDIVREVGGMARDALNRGMISANQLGPVPEGQTLQDHIQSIAEKAANAALMGAGAVGAAARVKLPTGELKTVPESNVPRITISEEAPPSVAPAGEPATGAAPGSAVVGSGEALPTPQAKAEATPVPTEEQVGNVTQGVTEPVVTPSGPQMGAAGIEEIPETGAGGEKYGVAERIRTERAKAGQVEPVEPGQGMSTQQTIEIGRDIIRRDPEAGTRIMESFENDPKKHTSAEGIAVVRAHGESLASGARRVEEEFGTESPEYQAAKNYLSDWDKRSKAMQTEWHKQGMGQQGETDIDTGSYTGLERARRQTTGEDIPESKKPQARKIAKQNRDAQEQVARADAVIKSHIQSLKGPTMSEAEKRAFDAANKTVREAAVRAANAENKARVAEEVRKQAVEQVQKDAVQRAEDARLKVIRDDAVRKAREENKNRVKQAQRDLEVADIERQRTKRAQDAAEKTLRDMRVRAAKEGQRRAADPSIPVWESANKYLDENKGLYNFDDIVNKVAVDVKMKPQQVRNILAQDATTKRLSTDLLMKQARARRLKEQAKAWLKELDTPGYQKVLTSIPDYMFGLSVFGHGFVALGTHAPIVAFQPRFWNAYVSNFGKMYRMVFNPAYYEAQMQDLVRRPNYDVARASGLQNDPFKYEEFHRTALRNVVYNWIGEKNKDRVDNIMSAGNRGYGVLKLLRQDMFDQRYDNLPKRLRAQTGVVEGISDGVNHATGVTKRQAPQGVNIALFAPRLEASRIMWLAGDPGRALITLADWRHATDGEREFAREQIKEKAWVFGTFMSLLAMNQGFLSATGSTQKINGLPEIIGGAGIDPLAGDFMKFKVAGKDIAYGGALLTMAKLPARVATAILYEGKGSKYILEDERVDKVIGQYIRSQASPFAGTVADLALGRDYEERPLPAKMFGTVEQTGTVPKRLQNIGVDEPYDWLEFTSTKLPIPIADGIKEGLRGAGMDETQSRFSMKQMAVTSLLQTMTGARITEDTREE